MIDLLPDQLFIQRIVGIRHPGDTLFRLSSNHGSLYRPAALGDHYHGLDLAAVRASAHSPGGTAQAGRHADDHRPGLSVVVPIVLLVASLSESVAGVVTLLRDLTSLKLGEPPTWLANIPLLGTYLDAQWHKAMVDMPATLEQVRPYIEQTATWILKQAATFGTALLEFLVAVIISGFLYAGGETLAQAVQRFALRTAGERGLSLVDVAERTIRTVAQGVIGTAVLQGLLIEFSLIMAGVPGSPLLGFLTFLLAVMQLPTFLVWAPAALWLGYEEQMGWAIFTAAWGLLVVGTVDNFLRPYFISQGSRLPLLLIFAGVLGGLLAWGLIGIFLGATLLAVGYTLLSTWLYEELTPAEALSKDG